MVDESQDSLTMHGRRSRERNGCVSLWWRVESSSASRSSRRSP
nr:hypothetical protein JVH1_4588 [Rhodococcus sp. JVH1]